MRRRCSKVLGDHSSHADADDMGPGDCQPVENGKAVIGHVVKSVWGARRYAEFAPEGQPGQAGRTQFVHATRKACVSVIHSNHAQPGASDRVDELARPEIKLQPQPHDHQDGRCCHVTLVFDRKGPTWRDDEFRFDQVHVARKHIVANCRMKIEVYGDAAAASPVVPLVFDSPY